MLSSLHEIKRRKMTAFILLIDFELIHSFLTNRSVQLKVNGFIGPRRKCRLIGLPQGAVLYPLLFIIYIADLLGSKNLPPHISEFTECYKYADDGSVSVIASSLSECLSNMQKVCDYIHSWCKLWRLVINCDPNKTEIIILRTQKSDQIDHTVSTCPYR